MGLAGKILGGRDDHYCHPPRFFKKAGDRWRCPSCGNGFTYKLIKGKLHALQTSDGRPRR